MAKPVRSIPAVDVHAEIIAGILASYHEAFTSGFMRALRDIPDGDYMGEMYDHHRDWWKSVPFIPDAYLINHDAREGCRF